MSRKTRIIAGLDIGSTKVCCFIAELGENYVPRVIGYGQHASGGMKRGMIVDMDRTENAIREAVHQAEEMADVQINGVIVGLGGVHLRSHMTDGLVVLNNHEITDEDIAKVIEVARAKQLDGDRQIIHAEATRYLLDNQTDIRDPRGMMGSRLEADVHIISAASSAVRNVVRCVERSNLEVQDIVVKPYASAMSCLVQDERELGVALVDMGGGTCDIAIYSDGALVYTAVVPLGGQHITADIARGLSTPLSHAERIKNLYGCAMASAVNEDENIEIPRVGEDDEVSSGQITRGALAGIIQPRCEEMLEMVRDKIEQSGFESAIGRRVVLTGGTSQLAGMRKLSDMVLDKTSRLARPTGVEGLTDLSGSPQFSTAAGLVVYGAKAAARENRARKREGWLSGVKTQFGRLLKESFQTS